MAPNVRYIESTGKRFYKSDFPPISATGCVEIKLRGSESNGWTSAPHWNRHSDNSGKSTRKKKKPVSPPEPKVMFIANAYKGHAVMLTQEQVFARTGIKIGDD